MAGGPYGCASVYKSKQKICSGNGDYADQIDADALVDYALSNASKGLIAPLDNL